MEDIQQPSGLQRRIGVLILVMAGAIAVTPLALALALRQTEDSTFTRLLVISSVLWLLAVATHRGLTLAHERWRRKTLRRAIAEARSARLSASTAFQDTLHVQSAILDRIINISEVVLRQGVVDPTQVLENVRLMNTRAREAQHLIEDAVAEIKVETGSATFSIEQIDVRGLVEDIAAPFIRAGDKVTTAGPRYFAATDAAVLRLLVRGMITHALETDAAEVDVTVTRNSDLVMCTISDDGPDRGGNAIAELSPAAPALVVAVNGSLSYDRALGWNRFCVSLPLGQAPDPSNPLATPLDVLGMTRSVVLPQPAVAPKIPGKRVVAIGESVNFSDPVPPPRRPAVVSPSKSTVASG